MGDANRRRIAVDNLAAGLNDPQRQAEVVRHHTALVGAMNASHVGNEQDVMAVFEAISPLLGQVIANFDPRGWAGILTYVEERAYRHAIEFLHAGNAAKHLIVRDDA